MIKILIGLLALMLANILLGTSVAALKKAFETGTLIKGITKIFLIFLAILLTYLCAYLNPDIISLEVKGMIVNLESAMNISLLGIMGIYANQVVKKIVEIFELKVNEGDDK